MDWSRISTGLLLDKIPERDVVAIIKFQLLWAHLEREPTSEIALRHMSPKQLERARAYHESISGMVIPDIRKLVLKRGRDKQNYYKSKGLKEIQYDGTDNGTAIGPITDPPPQRISDESKINKTKENKIKNDVVVDKTQSQRKGFNGISLPPMKF